MITFMPSSYAVETPEREILLRPGQTTAYPLSAGTTITVLTGIIWLTQQNDADDHVLQAGQTHVLTHGGRVVLQSLRGPAAIGISA